MPSMLFRLIKWLISPWGMFTQAGRPSMALLLDYAGFSIDLRKKRMEELYKRPARRWVFVRFYGGPRWRRWLSGE